MKILLTFFFVLSVAVVSTAQNTGFYGRTAFIELNSAVSYPLLNRFRSSNFNNRLYTPDNITTALNVVIGKAVAPKLSLSLEGGIFFGNFSAYDNDYYEDYFDGTVPGRFSRFEKLSYRTVSIMPKFEISGIGGNAPGGMSHQLGFGYTSTKIVDKDYDYAYRFDGDSLNFEEDIANYDQAYSGFTFLYAINMRVPITKTFLFNYGLRVTLNFTKKDDDYTVKDRLVTDYEAAQYIKETRIRSVFNFQIGFTYLL